MKKKMGRPPRHVFRWNGEEWTIKQLSARTRIPMSMLLYRLVRKRMPVEQALSTPHYPGNFGRKPARLPARCPTTGKWLPGRLGKRDV